MLDKYVYLIKLSFETRERTPKMITEWAFIRCYRQGVESKESTKIPPYIIYYEQTHLGKTLT